MLRDPGRISREGQGPRAVPVRAQESPRPVGLSIEAPHRSIRAIGSRVLAGASVIKSGGFGVVGICSCSCSCSFSCSRPCSCSGGSTRWFYIRAHPRPQNHRVLPPLQEQEQEQKKEQQQKQEQTRSSPRPKPPKVVRCAQR